jgi:hypothetical protein
MEVHHHQYRGKDLRNPRGQEYIDPSCKDSKTNPPHFVRPTFCFEKIRNVLSNRAKCFGSLRAHSGSFTPGNGDLKNRTTGVHDPAQADPTLLQLEMGEHSLRIQN